MSGIGVGGGGKGGESGEGSADIVEIFSLCLALLLVGVVVGRTIYCLRRRGITVSFSKKI